MRTTLTLDDDVAARIERLRKTREQGLKEIVNEALRRGLDQMAAKPKKRAPFRTGVHRGRLLVENVKDALAMMDEDYDRKKRGS